MIDPRGPDAFEGWTQSRMGRSSDPEPRETLRTEVIHYPTFLLSLRLCVKVEIDGPLKGYFNQTRE